MLQNFFACIYLLAKHSRTEQLTLIFNQNHKTRHPIPFQMMKITKSKIYKDVGRWHRDQTHRTNFFPIYFQILSSSNETWRIIFNRHKCCTGNRTQRARPYTTLSFHKFVKTKSTHFSLPDKLVWAKSCRKRMKIFTLLFYKVKKKKKKATTAHGTVTFLTDRPTWMRVMSKQ